MLPKVKFKKLDIESNLDSLVFYANPKNSEKSPLNFYYLTLKLFPNLDNKITSDMSYKDIYLVLDKEVRPILKKLEDNSKDIDKYQSIWDKVNDDTLKDLENTLDIEWNSDDKIFCEVGLLPVAPRDIVNKTFNVNYGIDCNRLISTGIHELCHFLYFEKWKEIYPNYSEEEFDFPHIAWYLSEAMIDPLINNDTFKKYTSDDLSSYSTFYEILIDNKSIIEILRDYVNNYSIDIAIKKGYELFKENEDKIKNYDN